MTLELVLAPLAALLVAALRALLALLTSLALMLALTTSTALPLVATALSASTLVPVLVVPWHSWSRLGPKEVVRDLCVDTSRAPE